MVALFVMSLGFLWDLGSYRIFKMVKWTEPLVRDKCHTYLAIIFLIASRRPRGVLRGIIIAGPNAPRAAEVRRLAVSGQFCC